MPLSVIGAAWAMLLLGAAPASMPTAAPASMPTGIPTGIETPTTLIFVGDVSFAGRPKAQLPGDDRGSPVAGPMAGFKQVFDGADVVIANAEGLLMEAPSEGYANRRLNISADAAWALSYARVGIDLVNVANNHSWDEAAPGAIENLKHLHAAKVATFGGAPSPVARQAHRVDLARGGCASILPATLKSNRRPPTRSQRPHASRQQHPIDIAYYPGDKGLKRLLATITAEASTCGAVIVYVHWGREGRHAPTRATREAAHSMIDAGADLIIGHHPHVLQGFERYGGGVIAYSLGNFLFTNRNLAKRTTGALRVTLDADAKGRVSAITFIPGRSDRKHLRPSPAAGPVANEILADLVSWSAALGTTVTPQGDVLVIR